MIPLPTMEDLLEMNYSIEGKKALICGSTQGIGLACATEIARMGGEVVLMARHEEALEIAQKNLPCEHGQSHSFIVVDFSDWQSVQTKANEYVQANGPIHILVNNTGGPPAGPVFEATPEDLQKALNMHVVCNQVLVQAVAGGMREEKYGRIINIISTSVITPIRGLGVSNTTRGAVGNWARTLAGELGPFGITVNNILPGFTKTARLDSLIKGRADRAGSTVKEIEDGMLANVPLRRFADPSEVGAVAAFLASPAASYLNGLNLPVDGGRLSWQ